MAELTIEQQRAVAIANARRRGMTHTGTSGETDTPGLEKVFNFVTAPENVPTMALGAMGMLPTSVLDRDYRDKFVDSATFGFGDSIAGAENYLDAAVTGRPTEGAYAEGRNTMRKKLAEYSKRSPVASTVADVSGALATGGGLARQGITFMGGGAGRSIANATARGAAEAGAYGALHGAGRADGENVISGAVSGGLTGMMIGGPTAGATHGLVNALKARAATKATPSLGDLRKGADAAYARARHANPQFPAFGHFAGQARAVMRDQGFHPKLHPNVAVALDEIEKISAGGSPDFKSLEVLRQIVKSASGSMVPAEKRLGTILVNGLDDMMKATAPTDDVALGRTLYGRLKRGELIEGALDKAGRRAARTGSGGNVENTIRQNIDAILNSEKLKRGFSEDDLALMRRIVEGAPGQDTLRLIGKLSPSGNGLMAALHGGAAVASSGATIPLAVAGHGAKMASDRMTGRMGEILSAQVRRGSAIPEKSPIMGIERYLAQAIGSRPEHMKKVPEIAEYGMDELVNALMARQ